MIRPPHRQVAVIDDEPDWLDTIRLVFIQIGLADPLLIQDLPSAWGLLGEESPLLVLVDLHMPRCEPVATVKRLRDLLPGSRLVVLSGQADPELAASCHPAGADAYLAKNGKRPLADRLREQWQEAVAAQERGDPNPFHRWDRLPTLAESADRLVAEALTRTRGRQAAAARLLGVSPQAINQRLRRVRSEEPQAETETVQPAAPASPATINLR